MTSNCIRDAILSISNQQVKIFSQVEILLAKAIDPFIKSVIEKHGNVSSITFPIGTNTFTLNVSDTVVLSTDTLLLISQLLNFIQSSNIYNLFLSSIDNVTSQALTFLSNLKECQEELPCVVAQITNDTMNKLINTLIDAILGSVQVNININGSFTNTTGTTNASFSTSVNFIVSILSQSSSGAIQAQNIFQITSNSIISSYCKYLSLLKSIYTKKQHK